MCAYYSIIFSGNFLYLSLQEDRDCGKGVCYLPDVPPKTLLLQGDNRKMAMISQYRRSVKSIGVKQFLVE